MAQEFPNGERVIFMGQMAYGAAAQVVASTKDTLDINLAVSVLDTRGKLNVITVLPDRVQGECGVLPGRCAPAIWSLLPFAGPRS